MAKNSPNRSGADMKARRDADNRVTDHNYASRKLQSEPITKFLNDLHNIERKAKGAGEKK